MATTLTSKGQVTIPKRIRQALCLKQGMRVEFILENGRAILEPVVEDNADEIAGSLKAYSHRLRGDKEKRVMEKVRREVAREASREGLPSRHKRSP